jgi:hypothetical protein
VTGRGFAAGLLRPAPEAQAGAAKDTSGMKVSYGVVWRVLGPRRTGRLRVGANELKLVAANGDGVCMLEIPFDEIERVELVRRKAGEERATVVARLHDGETVEIETTVARWIVDDLSGMVPVAGPAEAEADELPEWHPGLGL